MLDILSAMDDGYNSRHFALAPKSHESAVLFTNEQILMSDIIRETFTS